MQILSSAGSEDAFSFDSLRFAIERSHLLPLIQKIPIPGIGTPDGGVGYIYEFQLPCGLTVGERNRVKEEVYPIVGFGRWHPMNQDALMDPADVYDFLPWRGVGDEYFLDPYTEVTACNELGVVWSDSISPVNARLERLLGFLGYSRVVTGTSITFRFPGYHVLMARWEEARFLDPTLSELRLTLCDGVCSDDDFILSFISGQGVLSKHEEFLNDHCSHIVPQIRWMLALNQFNRVNYYSKMMDCYRKAIWDSYQVIQFLEQVYIPQQPVVPKHEFPLVQCVEIFKATLRLTIDVAFSLPCVDFTRIKDRCDRIRANSIEEVWIKVHEHHKLWAQRFPTISLPSESLAIRLENVWNSAKNRLKAMDYQVAGPSHIRSHIDKQLRALSVRHPHQ